ncbi:MAG: type IV pilus modification protein PilV [Proteobacteria bacterium]|nr:type IV pilus modification protein PilV [Pseudomonadota bacterium]
MHNKILSKQQGFSLVEVMIAVVVFSFGLLGIAGMMTVAVQSNHSGYMRSQAINLTSSINDMMSRNYFALWQGTYNGTYSGIINISGTSGICDTGDGCADIELANRDTQMWGSMISQALPNSSGEIDCVNIGANNALVGAGGRSTPYLGLCTITIRWSESNQTGSSNEMYQIVTNP